MKMTCIALLFELLDQFQLQKNKFAPVSYKTLTFLLIDNHDDDDIWMFILSNFSSLFKKCQSIPIAIVLEPFLKQF